jgi:putative IMPACT (imprinted ancient) family translation regulator
MSQNICFNFWQNREANFPKKIIKNVIRDRGSKYTVVWWRIDSELTAKQFVKDLQTDSYFRKASHNSYAYRLELDNWSIIESKNDDGEKWAGNCILRELQRESVVNTIVVVTRYFGGIQLHADRFKNVIEATKIFIKEIKKKED